MAGDTSADTTVSPSDSPSEGASSPNSTSSLDGSAAGGSSVGEDSELSPEELLAQARSEIEELKTQALYRQAEFENYRRRTIKEKTDLILNGSKSAVTAILPIVDDLERALPSMKNADDVAAVAEGVELILQKFLKALAGLGVKQIETEGKDFDVDLHEAIAQVPGVPDEQKGRVIDCVEKGYTLNDQVIRHAKVAVGM
ncbi:MAG: nucleotide exchange factor GrpE [Bacteroidaceae bacterium]|nr:nucleotide exchange factor GrpE [Bacteroidaceae bacterium]MBR1665726.1 nucleotide exchange factor GrpE [Bacteroidaceae bacterium]MBR1800398.1 nucleotide exchange factor GrpE [Bacteroidaceae bacterium]